jgi:hypothetical protein
MAASTHPLLEFQRLNSITSLYAPTTHLPSSSSLTHPTTILICPWLGVHPKSRTLASMHTKCNTLYPHAQIISIRTLPQYFFTTPTSTPVVPAIESDATPNKRILIHIFSNGGAVTFAYTCHVYKRDSGKILPVKAIVFDSAPGDPSFKEGWVTVSTSGMVPKGLWYPVAAMVGLVLGVMWIGKNVLGMRTLIDRSRGRLNDESLVDGKAKRLYVYSEADRVVG